MPYRVPLQNPKPDFAALERVILGEETPQRVHLVELGVDDEVMQTILEDHLNLDWTEPDDEITTRAEVAQRIAFFQRMGYDFCPLWIDWLDMPEFKERLAQDTAALSRGDRTWVDERGGIIKSWEDFYAIDWDAIHYDLAPLDYARELLSPGMKVTVGATVFEMILERFLGYQDLFMLSVDDPDLVEAVFQRWGQHVHDAYAEAVRHPAVGAIFHADDLGFKTSTLMSPRFLRNTVFPWFRRFAQLAHDENKTYWYHCCGNPREVMEDLIEDVRIDAFHSFQDVIIPVGEFLARYGDRVAALGGVDMDNLGRMTEPQLRQYVRGILSDCMPGRYALGSGNTVANYLPVRNYLAMLDEGLAWTS